MKIAIIGAGFTGLAAAWDLAEAGHEVTVFEASDRAGGLAAGFQNKEWEWPLELHYHHIFQSDTSILEFLKELGLSQLVQFHAVKTSTRYKGKHFRLDSAMSLLACPVLSPVAKFRTAATLAFLKLYKNWPIFEKWTAAEFIQKTMGQESWNVLWKPLFVGKFGKYATEINATWFWARIHARTPKLGYFTGGFQGAANQVVEKLKDTGVTVKFSTFVEEIKQAGDLVEVKIKGHKNWQSFDRVLVSSPSNILLKLIPSLPQEFQDGLKKFRGLGAMTLILEMNRKFFKDNTYWLNINETGWPFLAVVEHTHMAKSGHYNNSHLVYVAKYLDPKDPMYALDETQLIRKYHNFLDKLSPEYKKYIKKMWLFKTPFAQPLPTKNYAQTVPQMTTPLSQVFWCSMQHVYPWDRGTNFAVAKGREVAKMIG